MNVEEPRRMRHPGVRFPPPTLFVAGFLIGWLIHRAWPVPLVPSGRSPEMSLAGWILVTLGVAWMGWGLATFVRHRTAIFPHRPASTLVETGPYRFSRNPMYLGMTAAYLGGLLVTNMFWPLLLLPLVLLGLTMAVIQREERYLAEAFGPEYDEYRKRTRRWL